MSDPLNGSGTSDRVVVMLVDDQAMIGEAMRRICATQPDIDYHFCSDPSRAVALAKEVSPTVILQDLVMPQVDGLDLVLDYRREEATRLIPLIVLSSKEEAVTKAEAFARGANDYLVKLPDPLEIIARLRYHSRGYRALLQRNAAYRQIKEELDRAGDYVRSLLPSTLVDRDIRVRGEFIPSAQLGGDFFGWHDLGDGALALYLIDVCGHGVGPALLSVSVSRTLSAGVLAPADLRAPAVVLNRLNDAFPMAANHGMYFTGWYGVLDRKSGRLDYAGAGHPPAILVRASGEWVELESQGAPVGIAQGLEYEATSISLASGDRLYLYSDGIVEIPLPDGDVWSHSQFRAFAQTDALKTGDPIARMLEYTRGLQGGAQYADDVSLVEVTRL
jgi:sigma-B regulation protein RsbU (phosphoserine phosphatase)